MYMGKIQVGLNFFWPVDIPESKHAACREHLGAKFPVKYDVSTSTPWIIPGTPVRRIKLVKYALKTYSRRDQRDEISFRPLSFRPLRYGVYPVLDKHGGQRNHGTSASNPNDISHQSNGEQRQAGADRLSVLRQCYNHRSQPTLAARKKRLIRIHNIWAISWDYDTFRPP